MSIAFRVFLGFLLGWFIGFGMTRTVLKEKYKTEQKGTLRVAYDQDNPGHPAMGLEVDSLNYILHNDRVTLKIDKIGFPSTSDPVKLQSTKDKSA